RIDPEKNFSHAKFLFYGLPLDISYDSAIKCSLPLPVDKEGISGFWERLSRSNFTDLLKQTTFRKGEMNLNDWGVLELVHAIGKEIYQAENEAILFTWFLSLKCGFDTKVGFSGDQVCLLVPTDNTLYGVLFLTLNKTKQRYYVVSLDPNWKLKDEQIFTYEGSYPKAEGVVKFLLKAPPAIEHMSSSKTLKFSYAGQEHLIPIKFSKDAVRFLEYYPQTNFEVYFNAAASSEATTSLVSALRPLVEGKTEREAVNILLRFVQTAFRYKTDPEQFGREKPFFPDETLHYDYSDCEDRAILFAYLLRTLTGLKVIGLDFPGHIATAVKFTDEIPGDALTYQGKKFVICDPTYENADVGCCMPNFKGVAPKIISID
ncbi:MAG TPA: hypothetical protein DGH68_07465, partial [Bacteroidetes bacterium]|nr:hypothetical protein [Bacteroidota bacterium]